MLWRVLQEREFERVGGTPAIKIDIRLIAVTDHDFLREVDEGSFRRDLYDRCADTLFRRWLSENGPRISRFLYDITSQRSNSRKEHWDYSVVTPGREMCAS